MTGQITKTTPRRDFLQNLTSENCRSQFWNNWQAGLCGMKMTLLLKLFSHNSEIVANLNGLHKPNHILTDCLPISREGFCNIFARLVKEQESDDQYRISTYALADTHALASTFIFHRNFHWLEVISTALNQEVQWLGSILWITPKNKQAEGWLNRYFEIYYTWRSLEWKLLKPTISFSDANTVGPSCNVIVTLQSRFLPCFTLKTQQEIHLIRMESLFNDNSSAAILGLRGGFIVWRCSQCSQLQQIIEELNIIQLNWNFWSISLKSFHLLPCSITLGDFNCSFEFSDGHDIVLKISSWVLKKSAGKIFTHFFLPFCCVHCHRGLATLPIFLPPIPNLPLLTEKTHIFLTRGSNR